jgi:environmental stress-induced protein Ves
MEHRCGVLHAEEYRTAKWSGGSTTEMLIYPLGSSYAARDFLFRISSAVVTDRQSDFTVLPGVRRLLMVLEGELTLTHAETESIVLRPYETDSFPGNRQTKSTGTGRDFNLMMRKTCRGDMRHLTMDGCAEIPLDSKQGGNMTGLFVTQGSLRVKCGEEDAGTAAAGELFYGFCSDPGRPLTLKLFSEKPAGAVLVQVAYEGGE